MLSFPKKSFALLIDDVAHMGFVEAKNETFSAVGNFVKYCGRKNQ